MAESTSRPFDAIVRSIDASMTVVTASMSGQDAGCLIGFHSQCSIRPERWVAWVSPANRSFPVITGANRVAIHFLGDDQHDLAVLFGSETGDEVDKFAHCDVNRSSGPPVITRCANVMVADRVALLDDGGDHAGVVVEPVEVRAEASFVPLRLASVDDLDPGHEADDPPHNPLPRR